MLGIQAYWCQILILPQKVIKLIQAACRAFLWTGKSSASKKALVAWEKMCLRKVACGWDLICIKLWNKVAICKESMSEERQGVDSEGS